MMKALKSIWTDILNPAPAQLKSWSIERYKENLLVLNNNISILSTYQGHIASNQTGTYLLAEASKEVEEGDMIVLIIVSSESKIPDIKGFHCILSVDHDYDKDLSVTFLYKKYKNNEPRTYSIPRNSDELFVTAVTLRGADIVVDAESYINSGHGNRGLAYTPRVKTANEGALLTCFAYHDPIKVDIKNQTLLASMSSMERSMNVGISGTLEVRSERIKAISSYDHVGTGDDIAACISLY